MKIICITWTTFANNFALVLSIVVALLTIPKTMLEWIWAIAKHNKSVLREFITVSPKELITKNSNLLTEEWNIDKFQVLIDEVDLLTISSGFSGIFTRNKWQKLVNQLDKIKTSSTYLPRPVVNEKGITEDDWRIDFYTENKAELNKFFKMYADFYSRIMSKNSGL